MEQSGTFGWHTCIIQWYISLIVCSVIWRKVSVRYDVNMYVLVLFLLTTIFQFLDYLILRSYTTLRRVHPQVVYNLPSCTSSGRILHSFVYILRSYTTFLRAHPQVVYNLPSCTSSGHIQPSFVHILRSFTTLLRVHPQVVYYLPSCTSSGRIQPSFVHILGSYTTFLRAHPQVEPVWQKAVFVKIYRINFVNTKWGSPFG